LNRFSSYSFPRASGNSTTAPKTDASNFANEPMAIRHQLSVDFDRKTSFISGGRFIGRLPLSNFVWPKQPVLACPVSMSTGVVGQPMTIPTVPKHSGDGERVQPEFPDKLPAGMVVSGTSLVWTPTCEQIGETNISVNLKLQSDSAGGEATTIERTDRIRIEVERPYRSVPFTSRGLLIDTKQSFGLVWAGQRPDIYGQYTVADGKPPSTSIGRFSLDPKDVSSKLLQVAIPFNIKEAQIAPDKLVIQTAGVATSVEVYDVQTLKRIKSLQSATNIQRFLIKGDRIVLQGEDSDDVYDLKELSHVFGESKRSVSVRHQMSQTSIPYAEGTVVNGVFRDRRTGAATLVVRNPYLPLAPGGTIGTSDPNLLNRVPEATGPIDDPTDENVQRTSVEWSTQGWGASVELTTVGRWMRGSSSVPAYRRKTKLILHGADGHETGQIPIEDRQSGESELPIPILKVVGTRVYVASSDRLYVIEGSEVEQFLAAHVTAERFRFVPKQSEIVMRTPKMTLTHEVKGGVSPKEFFLASRPPGVTFDAASGNVFVERVKLLKAFLESQAQSSDRVNKSWRTQLTETARQWSAQLETLVGERIKGIPYAVPIQMRCVDGSGDTTDIEYFIIVELPLSDVFADALPESSSESNKNE
jgi:hypothetical protein